MGEHDACQKLKIKNRSENRRPIKDSDIQVGNTVLVKQPKLGKFSTPYHPVPLTVTRKNHSMLTPEGGDQKVTRNSSYFKKLFSDTPVPSLSDALEETSSDKDVPGILSPPVQEVKTTLTQYQWPPTQVQVPKLNPS